MVHTAEVPPLNTRSFATFHPVTVLVRSRKKTLDSPHLSLIAVLRLLLALDSLTFLLLYNFNGLIVFIHTSLPEAEPSPASHMKKTKILETSARGKTPSENF